MATNEKAIALTFSNYNFTFEDFFETYKKQCLLISEKTKIIQIKEIRNIISTFIYEYDYTIKDVHQRNFYRKRLKELKEQMNTDAYLQELNNKDMVIMSNIITYKRVYYNYFLNYLEVLGRFVTELTTTYMPNTNLQRKLIKFSNNQIFFQKFTQHKKIVLESLSEFTIRKFSSTFNKLLTFYYAYNLFINKKDKITIDRLFSIVLSIYLDKETLSILSKENPTSKQRETVSKLDTKIHESLLYINSMMNQSFSNYDVLPKLQQKVHLDKTLI